MPGTLVSPDGRRLPLARNTLLGSGEAAGIRVTARKVSQIHALCRWRSGWEVIDIASSNGTRLGGVPVEPGRPARMEAGSSLSFGPDSGAWILEDASGPGLHAVRLRDRETVSAPGGVLLLPHSGGVADVYEREEGEWCVDREEVSTVEDGSVVLLDEPWRIHLPISDQTEVAQFRLEDCVLHLWPAGDDGARAVLETPAAEHELRGRAHWGLALVLGRAMLDRDGLAHELGWVDNSVSAKELRIDEDSVAEYASRIRKDLAGCPVLLPGRAVEPGRHRRRLTGVSVRIYESGASVQK